jgi:Leucine-rich repeat (LRR) protein
MKGDVKVLLEFRKLSPHLKKVWKLKVSSDLTRIVLEGVTVNANGRVTGLNLYKKGLDGEIPRATGELAELKSLSLPRNDLYGAIPPLVNLKHLEEIHLYQNRLEGQLPAWIGELTALANLNIHSNWFGGPVPDSLSNLSKLKSLNLAQNEFNGVLPLSLIRRKSSGCNVYLTKNKGFTLPDNIGELCNEVSVLNLSDCSLTGSIPDSIGDISSLEELYLGNNKLSGSIPGSISKLGNLGWLDLSKNSFTGPLPDSFGQCSSLENVELGDNQLSGSLPSHIGSASCLPKVKVLVVCNNPELTGAIDLDFLNKCTQCDVSGCMPELQPPAKIAEKKRMSIVHTMAPVPVADLKSTLERSDNERPPPPPSAPKERDPAGCCSLVMKCFGHEEEHTERF